MPKISQRKTEILKTLPSFGEVNFVIQKGISAAQEIAITEKHLGEKKDNATFMRDFCLLIIKDWDLTDDDGNKIEINEDTIKELANEDVLAIFAFSKGMDYEELMNNAKKNLIKQ